MFKIDEGIEETKVFSRITRGDRMDSKTRENGAFQWTVWAVGTASLLLLISVGLELFVQRALGHNSVAIVILDLFLGLWSYVLGLGLLVFLSVYCLVMVRRVRVTRAAMSGYTAAEPRSRGLEKSEQEAHQSIDRRVAGVPIRSTRRGENANERHSHIRAA
jgi:hypothetical protein